MSLLFMQGSDCDGLKTINEDLKEYHQSLEKSICRCII